MSGRGPSDEVRSPGASAPPGTPGASAPPGTPGASGHSKEPAFPVPVESDRAPEPLGPYPHAVRAGGLLFLSGIGPRRRGSAEIPGVVRDDDGRVVAYDVEVQCGAAFDNVRTVLEDAGSSWEKIVEITVFLADLGRDFAAYNRVYAERFAGVRPARTTVGVTALPGAIAVEVKVVALV